MSAPVAIVAALFVLGASAAVDQYLGDRVLQERPLSHRQHRFRPAGVPEVQVGCADGAIRRHKRQAGEEPWNAGQQSEGQGSRERRDYVVWYGSGSGRTQPQEQQQQQQFTGAYQLNGNMPYWIPIWGNPRGVPVFFPAKPILFNPGYPVRNKPTKIQPTPTSSEPEGPITIGSRIKEDGSGIQIEDDRPIWGIVEASPTASSIPSKPRRRPSSPPLIHKPSLTEEEVPESNILPEVAQEVFGPPPPTSFSTTSRPPPSNFNNGDRNIDVIQDVFGSPASFQSPIPSTSRPLPPGNAKVGSIDSNKGPNRCVWAIISCCSPASQQVRYNCFEQLGCPGAFWDMNPCSREVTIAAINAAQKFYDQS